MMDAMLRPAAIIVPFLVCGTFAFAAEPPVRFEGDVLPILTQRCGSCHGRNEPEAGLSFGDLAAATT